MKNKIHGCQEALSSILQILFLIPDVGTEAEWHILHLTHITNQPCTCQDNMNVMAFIVLVGGGGGEMDSKELGISSSGI